MAAKYDICLKTRKDLLSLFSGLVKTRGEYCEIPLQTCIQANYILEEEERQRVETARQVQELEKHLDQVKETYQDMLAFLAELLSTQRHTGNGSGMDLVVPVKQLRDAIEKAAGQELIENAFESLKDAVLSETRDNTRKIDRGRLLGLMGKWLRIPEDGLPENDQYLTLFIHCKESYLHILIELSRVLSSKHRQRIQSVETELNKAEDIRSLSLLKSQVVDLLQEYVAESANDKAQAVIFAEAICRRILEMDKRISGSVDAFQAYQEQNSRFNEMLSGHIQSLKDTMSISAPMQELTQIVNSKISLLSEALAQKKSVDYSEEQRLKKQVGILKAGLKRIREDYRAVKEQNQALESELNTDHLTGAANRRAYEAGASKEMQRFMRYQRTFSLIIFDVDHFKAINDTYGHAIGDKCLKEIIARIKTILRKTDILARTGGDEFVIILPETGTDQAVIAAQKIRKAISSTEFIHKRDRVHVSLSLGVAEALKTDADYAAVFQRADQALYAAKQAGRNQVASAGNVPGAVQSPGR